MKVWLKKHGAIHNEVSVYVSQLRDLLHQPDMSSYTKKRDEYKLLWSEPFKDYYRNEIDSQVSEYIQDYNFICLFVSIYRYIRV